MCIRDRDGTIHCLKGSNSLVAVTEDSQVIQRMFIDVTESRQLEEQLELEREMYRLAMESSSDVMYEYTCLLYTSMQRKCKINSESCIH